MPRVCLVIDNLNIGGSEIDLADLARGLHKRGYHVFICCLRAGGALVKEVEQAGVKVVILGKKSRFDFTLMLRLADLLKKEKIDIVHSSLFSANFFSRTAAILAGTPVIIASDQSLGIGKGFLRTSIDRILKYCTDMIISDSTAVSRLFVERDHYPPQKVRAIVNGIDLTKLNGTGWREEARKELLIGDDELIAGTLTRFTFEKGLVVFADAMPLILQACKNCRFLIVGDAELEQEKKYKRELEKKIKELGIEKKIIFTGFRRDIGRMLAAMDVFVSPSIIENFPNTVMEAMGAGKSVVATEVGSIREAVIENQTGFLVPAGNVQALAEAIILLFKNKGLNEKMAVAGKERAFRCFSRERVVGEAVEVYQKFFPTPVIPNN